MLAEDLVVLGDQEAGNGIARKVFCQRRPIAAKIIADVHRRAFEHPRYSRAPDAMRWEDFVEVAVGADAIFYLMGLAGLMSQRAIGNRIVLCGSIELGVWTQGREGGTRAIVPGRAVGNLFSNGRAGRGGNGEAGQGCAARKEERC